ncbi:MAG: hypothetical protein JWP51_5092 [Bradyrhizobium sp.]|nr:hypothetical protein [Bradyrhizobium sp.]
MLMRPVRQMPGASARIEMVINVYIITLTSEECIH